LLLPGWGAVTDAAPVTVNNAINVTITNNSSAMFFRLYNPNPPAGMVLIPAGTFTIGNSIGDNDAAMANANPTNVTVSAFYMDVNLVSYSQWQTVYNWATSNGYGFVNVGAGKAASHPAQTVDWYDVVKWSNARSQQAGLTPVYYTDAGLTQVYTNGEVTPFVNWTAGGYRLPTEAEWEKAARGGLSGLRFPWGNTISENQANYYGDTNDLGYDLGPNGYNSIGSIGGTSPATSPVGSFVANGYGLYDMAGNVAEWCGDWYDATPYAGGSDPRGPASGSNRVLRGGVWADVASDERCAYRNGGDPNFASYNYGFRCVRGL
jgi:formylglycine-generating enzyme required for sulfatase activity